MSAEEVQETPSLITHKFDGHGKLISKNPYRLHTMGPSKYFEFPVNSGNLWCEDLKTPAGRMVYEVDSKGKRTKRVDPDAAHVKFVRPLQGAEKIAAELADAKAELAAIKADLEKKVKPQEKAK